MSFTYGATAPIQVAVLDNGTGTQQNILLPNLRSGGFHAECIVSAGELYRAVVTQSIAIVVLDTHHANEDAFAVTQYLREISDVGIVMLMGWDGHQDSIKAMRSGADLCLAKPIDTELLIVSLHSLNRRLNCRATFSAVADQPSPPGWKILDDGWRLAAPNGEVVVMTASEQRIIKTLGKENGKLVLRIALMEAAAQDAEDLDPHRLEMAIHRLRAKVQQQAGEELPLKTVRGKGYLLICEAL
ncbi:winged helix-turn-helix domain-containing protein [Dyella sp. 2HG41-7]|uniref:response regulator transcription factor n=1 Tax=Dyella sp. 2HG41-7 TaxID=2883239 RepID=UPI001F184092|nr:winged helix-turn-helix domain-containing protein [Dyella sp. 2HG41-7]